MKTFLEYLSTLREGPESGAYMHTLDRLEMLVGGYKPYGFDKESDDDAYRARKDVLDAIIRIRAKSGNTIDINQPRHVA